MEYSFHHSLLFHLQWVIHHHHPTLFLSITLFPPIPILYSLFFISTQTINQANAFIISAMRSNFIHRSDPNPFQTLLRKMDELNILLPRDVYPETLWAFSSQGFEQTQERSEAQELQNLFYRLCLIKSIVCNLLN